MKRIILITLIQACLQVCLIAYSAHAMEQSNGWSLRRQERRLETEVLLYKGRILPKNSKILAEERYNAVSGKVMRRLEIKDSDVSKFRNILTDYFLNILALNPGDIENITVDDVAAYLADSDSLAIDVRPLRANMLSSETLGYYLALRESINPEGEIKENGAYIGSGAGVLEYFYIFDTDEGDFADIRSLEKRSAFTDKGECDDIGKWELITKEQYAQAKREEGYVSYDMYNGLENIMQAIIWELEAMGAFNIRIFKVKNHYRVNFDWAYWGKEMVSRKINFYDNVNGVYIGNHLRELEQSLDRGIFFYMEKGGEELNTFDRPWITSSMRDSHLRYIADRIKENGVAVVDHNHFDGLIFDSGDRYFAPKAKNERLLAYENSAREQGEGIKYGYGNNGARLLMKAEGAGQREAVIEKRREDYYGRLRELQKQIDKVLVDLSVYGRLVREELGLLGFNGEAVNNALLRWEDGSIDDGRGLRASMRVPLFIIDGNDAGDIGDVIDILDIIRPFSGGISGTQRFVYLAEKAAVKTSHRNRIPKDFLMGEFIYHTALVKRGYSLVRPIALVEVAGEIFLVEEKGEVFVYKFTDYLRVDTEGELETIFKNLGAMFYWYRKNNVCPDQMDISDLPNILILNDLKVAITDLHQQYPDAQNISLEEGIKNIFYSISKRITTAKQAELIPLMLRSFCKGYFPERENFTLDDMFALEIFRHMQYVFSSKTTTKFPSDKIREISHSI